MATKKFIIEVEEGVTKYCENCPLLHLDCTEQSISCANYNLATMKITEYNEPTCYDLQCLSRNPNKLIENEK